MGYRTDGTKYQEGYRTVWGNSKLPEKVSPDMVYRSDSIAISRDMGALRSPIACVQRTRSTRASHSAVLCGTNVTQMNANRVIQIAVQRTQGRMG